MGALKLWAVALIYVTLIELTPQKQHKNTLEILQLHSCSMVHFVILLPYIDAFYTDDVTVQTNELFCLYLQK